MAAQRVGHCLGFGLAVEVEATEVEATAAQRVRHCLGFGLAVDVEAPEVQGDGPSPRACRLGSHDLAADGLTARARARVATLPLKGG
jgi:hypothetical protein